MKLFKVLKNKTIIHEGRIFDFKKDTIVEESVITRIYKDDFVCVGEKIYKEAPFSQPDIILNEEKEDERVLFKPEDYIIETKINNIEEGQKIEKPRNTKTKKGN